MKTLLLEKIIIASYNGDRFVNWSVMGNLMQSVINSIDEYCDLEVIRYSFSASDGSSFYLMEQSSIQVLRELPLHTPICVTDIFSERARIQNRVEKIKAAKTVEVLFDIIIPLVENGTFPCKDFRIKIGNQIVLASHDDGEVNLLFATDYNYSDLMNKIFSRQYYRPELLMNIVAQPNLYHKLVRPCTIESSYETFDQLIEAW